MSADAMKIDRAPRAVAAVGATHIGVVARIAAIATLLLLAGCERTMRDMYDQPRYKPLARSPLWPDGRSSRPPVAGTVARSEGTFAGTTSGRLGVIERAPAPGPLDTIRDALRPDASSRSGTDIASPPISVELLSHGRDRFNIFCAPCHSVAGDGDGMIPRRGFPHPPSFHTDRLRDASNAHFYAVITEGYGVMHSYATRVPPDDRLAIVAYVRALQWSQHVPVAALDGFDLVQLDAAEHAARARQGPRDPP